MQKTRTPSVDTVRRLYKWQNKLQKHCFRYVQLGFAGSPHLPMRVLACAILPAAVRAAEQQGRVERDLRQYKE